MINLMNDILGSFRIGATCVSANNHRHFSFFDVKLEPGCRINDISKYSKEIAIAIRAKTPIIVNPIPEKGIVRLQTTHDSAQVLSFYDYYRDVYNRNMVGNGILPFLLGETDEGQPLWIDMCLNPHMLVAGSTGSGKSVLLHVIIANAIMRPDTYLCLSDPKRVEFSTYRRDCFRDKIKFCADDYDSTLGMLQHLYDEMEYRYDCLSRLDISSIEHSPNVFKKLLIVIDEAADLMLHRKDKVFENIIVKLAQKSRAVGIFLVLATQRPSVDVLTGLIKANFPARIACKVSSKVDSRVILDSMGAEGLAGRGDAIINNYLCNNTRFQVAYCSPSQIIENCLTYGYN